MFNTIDRPGPEDGPDDGTYLGRFFTWWRNHSELRYLRRRKREAMAAITSGARATKSGKPPGGGTCHGICRAAIRSDVWQLASL